MIDQASILIAIGMMAVIIYLTRACGYFVGLQLRHIAGIKPILEALPGCAFMAILVPAARQASLAELIALVAVILIMWRSNNVVIATCVGLAILLFGSHYFDSSSL